MRFTATKSNTIGNTFVNIACHVPPSKEKDTETEFREKLGGVGYNLERIMGLKSEDYHEFNLVSSYEVSMPSGQLESNGMRPGYVTPSVKVSTFSGDHKTIDSLLEAHKKQCDENVTQLGAMLAGMGLSPEAVMEHILFYRAHVRGA